MQSTLEYDVERERKRKRERERERESEREREIERTRERERRIVFRAVVAWIIPSVVQGAHGRAKVAELIRLPAFSITLCVRSIKILRRCLRNLFRWIHPRRRDGKEWI
jgi:hypothetical protein